MFIMLPPLRDEYIVRHGNAPCVCTRQLPKEPLRSANVTREGADPSVKFGNSGAGLRLGD